MEYTSKEKLDLDEINKKAKSTGFSDRARRYLASALLGINIMGAVPSFGNDVQATEYDLNSFNGPQFEEILENENDRKIDELNNKIIDEYGKIAEIDRSNLGEFSDRSADELLKKLPANNKVITVKGINDISIDKMLEYKNNGVSLVAFADKGSSVGIGDCYIPDDMIMFKNHYENFYGPIRDNDKLTQKQKFIAAMDVLRTLNSYDHEAYRPNNPTEYTNAAVTTARGQYGTVKYGKTVCAGYADSVQKICGMLGIKSDYILGYAGNAEGFFKLPPEVQQTMVSEITNGESFSNLNHAINRVTFDDGTSYMVDMTNYDGLSEMGYDKAADHYFMKGANGDKKFSGLLTINGQLCTANPEDRDVSSKSQSMSQDEIKTALDIAKSELPYIAQLTELDEKQRETGFSKESTSILVKMQKNIKKMTTDFKDRFMKPRNQLLPSATESFLAHNFDLKNVVQEQVTEIKAMQLENAMQIGSENTNQPMKREDEPNVPSNTSNGLDNTSPANTRKNEFRDMIAGNGEYARNADAYLQEYHNRQQDATQQQMQHPQQQALENDGQER